MTKTYVFLLALLIPLAIISLSHNSHTKNTQTALPQSITIERPPCNPTEDPDIVNTCNEWNPVVRVTVIPTPTPFTAPDGDLVVGYTEWWTENDVTYCDIRAEIPALVNDDPAMDTLGHELLHCILGNFHP